MGGMFECAGCGWCHSDNGYYLCEECEAECCEECLVDHDDDFICPKCSERREEALEEAAEATAIRLGLA